MTGTREAAAVTTTGPPRLWLAVMRLAAASEPQLLARQREATETITAHQVGIQGAYSAPLQRWPIAWVSVGQNACIETELHTSQVLALTLNALVAYLSHM